MKGKENASTIPSLCVKVRKCKRKYCRTEMMLDCEINICYNTNGKAEQMGHCSRLKQHADTVLILYLIFRKAFCSLLLKMVFLILFKITCLFLCFVPYLLGFLFVPNFKNIVTNYWGVNQNSLEVCSPNF